MRRLPLALLLACVFVNVGCQICPQSQFLDPNLNLCEPCFYACAFCSGYDYNDCTVCNPLRGTVSGVPINGACECMDNMDEDENGNCIPGVTNTTYSLVVIILLAVNCLLILFTTSTKGMRFFLYRMIEDFQEVSLIVFINLQFPQQLNTFLTKLYWFNFTSIAKIFESMAEGTLFIFSPSDIL